MTRIIQEGPWKIFVYDDFDAKNAQPSDEFFKTIENAPAHIVQNFPADIRQKFEQWKRRKE